MSREHDARHEEVLEALATSEGDRTELLARIRGCAVCEQKLLELDLVAELLATTGDDETSLRTESLPAFASGEAAGTERLRALAADEFGATERATSPGGAAPGASPPPTEPMGGDRSPADGDGPRRDAGPRVAPPTEPRSGRAAPRPRIGLLVGLAAAAAILIFLWPRLDDGGTVPPSGDVLIGDEALELLSPAEATVARDAFTLRWSGELAGEGDAFVLRIQDEDGVDVPGSPLRLEETTWTPPPERIAAWPDVVRIQVAVVDFLGEESDHSAWRVVSLDP